MAMTMQRFRRAYFLSINVVTDGWWDLLADVNRTRGVSTLRDFTKCFELTRRHVERQMRFAGFARGYLERTKDSLWVLHESGLKSELKCFHLRAFFVVVEGYAVDETFFIYASATLHGQGA
jgi:hypothetical protein